MKQTICALLLICSSSLFSVSYSQTAAFIKSFSRGKIDTYHNFEGVILFDIPLNLRSSMGIGVMRSYVQQRFHPRLSQAIGYSFEFNSLALIISPEISGNWSKYSLTEKTEIENIEFQAGYHLFYGQKWRIFQSSGIGLGRERTSFDLRTNYFTYHISLGLAYVW